MDPAGAPVRRARWTLASSGALVAAILAGTIAAGTGTAAGQEGGPPSSTTAPPTSTPDDPTSTTTSSTLPPSTVVLEDGDIGIIPPGSGDEDIALDDVDGETSPEDVDLDTPREGEVAIDEELPLVVLPDPTPGLNAALADIDVSNARAVLADGEAARRTAEAGVAEAYAARTETLVARRAAGLRVLVAKALIEQFAVRMVVQSDVTSLEPLFGAADLDDLWALELNEHVADKVKTDLDATTEAYRRSIVAELAATAQISEAEAKHRNAQATYLELRTGVDEAIRHAEEARLLEGPLILGPAVLDVEDLVAWYRTYYKADPPVGSIESIIESYLRVGEEEGVAGDIAFAQAILETGGFRSGHARKWNFAGIGAYDSCSPTCSFSFPNVDDGVRAHLHLLRAYADPGLTTAQLAAPPNRQVAPERVGVRGCCQRWTQLTGVWATDPNYDRKVLGIYRLMIEIATGRDVGQT